MSRRLLWSSALLALLIVGCSHAPLSVPHEDPHATTQSTEAGVAVVVFGPVVATRTAASGEVPRAPTEWTFEVTHPTLGWYWSNWCDPTSRLVVTNGHPDGTGRVGSAWVFVDGVLTIPPSAFSPRVAVIEREVTLAEGSEITVRVAGGPAGRLEITAVGTCLPMDGIIGTSVVEIPRTTRTAESVQGNLVADALIDQYGTDFAIMNSAGLRADLTRPPTAVDPPQLDDVGNYNITRQDVFAMLPFGNLTTLADVDGPLLREILENGVRQIGGGRFLQVAGLRVDYAIDPSVAPVDNGGFPRGVIQHVAYWSHPGFADGTPVDLSAAATHTIAMNDFMAAGGDGYPVLGDRILSFEAPLALAVERYLLVHSPVNPQVEGRIVQVPMP